MPHAVIPTKRRVLVIGAGASGLAAIQQALEAGLEPVCIEARSTVGGIWQYEEPSRPCIVRFDSDGTPRLRVPGEGEVGVPPAPNPVYNGLRTNTPTPLMQYRGGPKFPPSVGLFCRHDQVFAYLDEFSKPFLPYIRFNTRVHSLRHTLPSDPPAAVPPSESLGPGREGPPGRRRWFASFGSTLPGTSELGSEQFDAVFVANGKYAEPYVPRIPGLSTFTGSLLHAKWYRTPDQFKDKNILIVGSAASGSDIAREAAQYRSARRAAGVPESQLPRIYQAIRERDKVSASVSCEPTMPSAEVEIVIIPPLASVSDKSVTLINGTTLDGVDTIIFATGYLYSYPFAQVNHEPFKSFPLTRQSTEPARADPAAASQSSEETVAGMRVHNLDDRLLFYLPDPTLVILTAPYLVIPFPLAQIQARLAARHFAESAALPAPLTFKPNPALRGPDGSENGAAETRTAVSWGEPFHSDMRDRMLQESGDIRLQLHDEERGSQDTEQAGVWGPTPQFERDLVAALPQLRKVSLGY
ncbi:hypothetical protein JCM3774_002559 [Rhodotorula dairenensis]